MSFSQLNRLSLVGKLGLALGVFIAAAVGGTAGVLSTQQKAAQAEQTVAAPEQRKARPDSRADKADADAGTATDTWTHDSTNNRPRRTRGEQRTQRKTAADEATKAPVAVEETADRDATAGTATLTGDDEQVVDGETEAPVATGEEAAPAPDDATDGGDSSGEETGGDTGEQPPADGGDTGGDTSGDDPGA